MGHFWYNISTLGGENTPFPLEMRRFHPVIFNFEFTNAGRVLTFHNGYCIVQKIFDVQTILSISVNCIKDT